MDEDFLRELRATFAIEAREHLHALGEGFLALERGADPQEQDRILSDAFRAAHSLKGAARAVAADEIEVIAHDLETLFDKIRSGELEPDPQTFDRLYEALDAMGALVGASTDAEPPDGRAGQPSPRSRGSLADPAAPERAAQLAGETIRVATAKLDTLVAQVGEMFVADSQANQLRNNLRTLRQEVTGWETSSRKEGPEGTYVRVRALRARLSDLDRTWAAAERRRLLLTTDLQAGVRHLRMLPIATVLDAFPRMIRDLTRQRDKEIDFVVEGADTEVDRSVLEQIKDPLTHLLRNCVDHAIESPDVRRAAGKPSHGTITVSANQRGDRLVIEVADDGAGIDPDRIRAAAVARGVLTTAEAGALDDRDASWLMFRSNVSTSPSVTGLSGRGVGLDVVHEVVRRLQGTIEVESRRNKGTRFSLVLPLEVAATRCLLVRAAGQTYALPTTSVVRIIRLDRDAVVRAGGREAVEFDEDPVMVALLEEALGVVGPADATVNGGPVPAVVAGSSDRRVALLVDALAGEQDAVIKSLPAPFVRVPGIAGATILGTGEVVIVLSVPDLVRAAGRIGRGRRRDRDPVRTEERVPTLLVADDSITTRTMEKNILEAAGFRVLLAPDGAMAWERLKGGGVDLLISDVTMPGMDGFELTARIRADEGLKELPVVLVTSLASNEHKERGVDVGADAYIVKSAFDQDRLLETVRRLL